MRTGEKSGSNGLNRNPLQRKHRRMFASPLQVEGTEQMSGARDEFKMPCCGGVLEIHGQAALAGRAPASRAKRRGDGK